MEKLFGTNAAVWFSKVCRFNHLMSKYIHIKVKGNNAHNMDMRSARVRYRINQE
jgi:hypothetical protein